MGKIEEYYARQEIEIRDMHQQMTSNHLLYDLLVYKIGFRFNYIFFHVNLMSI